MDGTADEAQVQTQAHKNTLTGKSILSMNFQFVGLFWDVFTVPVNHP